MCMCFACERSREKARQRGRRTHAHVCNSRCASSHCCSVLQCVAVCCSIPRFAQDTKAGAAPFFRFPMHNDTAVTVLVAMVAGCCSVLQCFAVRSASTCTRQTDRRYRPVPFPRTHGHKSHRASSKCCSVCAKRDREEAATLIFRFPMHKAMQRLRTRSAAARQVSNAHERDHVTRRMPISQQMDCGQGQKSHCACGHCCRVLQCLAALIDPHSSPDISVFRAQPHRSGCASGHCCRVCPLLQGVAVFGSSRRFASPQFSTCRAPDSGYPLM